MAKKTGSNPGSIHVRMIAVLRRFPNGITSGQIRQELADEGLLPGDQAQLDRRRRELKKWYVVRKSKGRLAVNGKDRSVTLYQYVGERGGITAEEGEIGIRLRAEVVHAAHGRCQMCGRTIEDHKIVLVVDHKKPKDWGGTNDRDNLWAICEECNAGKKAYFSSLDRDLMKRVTSHRSVHVRIGELLKSVGVGKRTPSSLIDVVADQDDWQKRLRELRYPVIGWKIATRLYKAPSGRKLSEYILLDWNEWPEDPSGTIRRFEKEREKRNAAKQPSSRLSPFEEPANSE